MTRLQDSVVMWLQGGLGNQLFQLNAAHLAAERAGCAFLLSRTSFFRDRLRAPALELLTQRSAFCSALQELSVGIPYDRSGAIRERTMLGRLPVVEDLQLAVQGSVLVGFFQDRETLSSGVSPVVNTLARQLAKMPSSPVMDKVRGRPVAHVRRGDYVSSPAARASFGELPPDYYFEAFQILGVNASECTYFTDDADYVATAFGVSRERIVTREETITDLASMLLMSTGSSIVIPNSSFSWWAAALMDRPERVVAPSTWFLDKPAAEGPLDERWLTVPGWP